MHETGTQGIRPEIRDLAVSLDQLKHYPGNPRQGDIGAISASLQAHGQYRPVVVRRADNTILAGNHTVAAARALGWRQVAATFVDVSDEDAARIVIVDNRTSDLATNDPEKLAALLQELAATPAGLAGSGYDGDALDELLADLGQQQPELRGDPDAVPEVPDEPVSRLGDLWLLGRHRLLVGDATSRADVGRLLDGERVDMVLTDPPYGIGLEAEYTWSRGNTAMGIKPSKGYKRITGDDRSFNYEDFAWLDCDEQFWWGAEYYVNTLPHCGMDGSWIVWDKKNDDLSAVWLNEFELCWSKQRHKKQVLRVLWNGALGTESEDTKRRVHPTQKPVRVLTPIIEQYSRPDACVLDLFAGSGSLMVACEQAGRRGRLLEIEPANADIICARFEALTGIPPVREPATAPAEACDHARIPAGAGRL